MKSIQEVVDFLTKRMLNERNLDSKSDYRKKKKKKKKEEEEEERKEHHLQDPINDKEIVPKMFQISHDYE